MGGIVACTSLFAPSLSSSAPGGADLGGVRLLPGLFLRLNLLAFAAFPIGAALEVF